MNLWIMYGIIGNLITLTVGYKIVEKGPKAS